MPENPPTTVRRRPTQDRSAERVARVLEATRALLADGGYEALTMKAIAARADVAVGSLYQFFASKQEVVGALGQGYLEEVEQVVQVLSARRFRSWERALDAVFDAYVSFYRDDPAFRALWGGSAAGLRVVGFGEISSAVAWPTDDARWGFKTLPTFRTVERFWRLSDGLRHGVSVRVIKGGKEWTSM